MDAVNEDYSITMELEKLFEMDDSIGTMEKVLEVNVETKENVESILENVASKSIIDSSLGCEETGPKSQKMTRRNKKKAFATRIGPKKDSDQSKKNFDQPKKDSEQPEVSEQLKGSDQHKKVQKQSNTKMVGRKNLPTFSCTDLTLKEPIEIGKILFRTPDFSLPEYSIGAHVQLEYSSKYVVHMSIVFLKKKQRGQYVTSKLKPRVDFVIIARNRKSDETTKIIRCVTCKFGEYFVYDDAYWNSVNVTNLKWFYALEEAMKFEVHVEPFRLAQSSWSTNGTLVWSLDRYLENEELQLKGAIEGVPGPYFYTSRRGYRVQINVWIHRKEGAEKGVWFEVCFLSGLYDHQLPKSFPHRTSIILARNYEPSDNLVRSVERDLADQPRYFIFFGSNTQVAGYVVDNSLQYKVVIEPLAVGGKKESKGNAEHVENDENVGVLEEENATANGLAGGNKVKSRRVEYNNMRKAELRMRKSEKIAKKREGKAIKALAKDGKEASVLKVLKNDANGEISKSDNGVLQAVIVGCEETEENDIFNIEADLNSESSYDKKKSGVFRDIEISAESEENDIFKIQTKIFEENFGTSYDKKKKSGAFKRNRSGRNKGGRRNKSDEMDENDIFKIGTDLNDENISPDEKLMIEADVMTMEKAK